MKTLYKPHKLLVALILIVMTIVGGVAQPAKAAACQAPSTDYGQASMSVSIPSTATYRIWTRMLVPDTSTTTYLLEVDGSQCYIVGGAVTPGSWVWVDYQQGSDTSLKVQQSLSQGSHQIKLIGRAPNVRIDRLVFTSDLACVPTGNGDNCNVPTDTTPPAVNLTAPTEGSTVSGKVSVTAAASDNVGVTKVEFYANSTLIGTSTTSPYSITWDTTTAVNGQQLLIAKAFDAAGNTSTSSYSVTLQNGDTQAPSTPANVTAQATAYNNVNVSWTASTDNVGVTGYRVSRNGSLVAQVGAVTTYHDGSVAPNTAYSYQVTAIDGAGNESAASAVARVTTPNVADSNAPTVPTNLTATAVSSQQVNLSWTASTDNIGVTGYDVYRAVGTGTQQKVATVTTTTYGDTGLKPKTQYSYSVKAHDAAGNTSAASNTASAQTLPAKRHSRIVGIVSGSVIPNARVSIAIEGIKYTTTTNRKGHYVIRGVPSGRYNVSYNAASYRPTSLSITVSDTTVVANVKLQKR